MHVSDLSLAWPNHLSVVENTVEEACSAQGGAFLAHAKYVWLHSDPACKGRSNNNTKLHARQPVTGACDGNQVPPSKLTLAFSIPVGLPINK